MAQKLFIWSQRAIDDALMAFEMTDGFDSEKMLAALIAAADVVGLNGPKHRTYRRMKPRPEEMPHSKQMDDYRQIVREELERFDLTWDYLLYGGQKRPVVDCRWTIMWRLRKEVKFSTPTIGRLLKCDHSSVVHACQMMDESGGKYFENKPIAESTLRQNRAKLKKIDERLENLNIDDDLKDIAA